MDIRILQPGDEDAIEAFLAGQQIVAGTGDHAAHHRIDPVGGFCAGEASEGWPAADATAEALCALLETSGLPDSAARAAAAAAGMGLATGQAIQLVVVPMCLAGLGIICSIAGIFTVKAEENAGFAKLLKSLHMGVWVSSGLIVVGSAAVLYFLLNGIDGVSWLDLGPEILREVLVVVECKMSRCSTSVVVPVGHSDGADRREVLLDLGEVLRRENALALGGPAVPIRFLHVGSALLRFPRASTRGAGRRASCPPARGRGRS